MPAPKQLSELVQAQPTLPGVGFAEECIARVHALYKGWFRQPQTRDVRAYLWDCCCTLQDRRFLCRIANVAPNLAELDFAELPRVDATTIFVRFGSLLQWVRKFERATDALTAELCK
jgi:hypothetical protein